VPAEPEPTPGIADVELARAAIESLAAWNDVACGAGGELPSLEARLAGHAECSSPGFSERAARNINSISVVEAGWAEPGRGQVALTTVTYDALTGHILDADIELNAQENIFTVGDSRVVADLRSTLTHEIGHLLGLDHSEQPEATMWNDTRRGSVTLRTLANDDIAAMCTAYPPEEGAPLCPNGDDPTRVCQQVAALKLERRGCAVASAGPDRETPLWPVALVVAALSLRRRRGG
jgi:MYXO-CTERM domain-containing protein